MRKTCMMLVVAGLFVPGVPDVVFAEPESEAIVVQEDPTNREVSGDRERGSVESEPVPEDEVVRSAAITSQPDVADDIDAFLQSRGWLMGENTRPDGTVFYISVGQGVIAAPRESKAYMNSRLIAFEKAVLEAKKEMVQYMESRVAKDVLGSYQEGATDARDIPDKETLLLRKAVDEALVRRGQDPHASGAPEKARELLSSSEFRSPVRTLAQARILGLQAFKTFEASPSGKQGQIGVICIHSDKLQQMAESMWTGAPMPVQSPKPPLIQQIPSDRQVLLSSYGVQQKTDENGNLVLVAFAQAQPVSSSVHSENAAYDKAKTNALGLLRQFAGETDRVATSSQMAESIKEYESAAIDYSNESSYRSQIQSYAEQMSISGVAVLKRWSAIHPLTGGKVVGVVCSWSPKSAQRALQLQKRVSGDPAQAPGSARDGRGSSPGSGQEGVYHGQGVEGDTDSF